MYIVVHLDGRTVCGLAKQFVRVVCDCARVNDFVVVTWLPRPVYPDRDPLTVNIHLVGGVNVNEMTNRTVSSLNDIQPSRVIVGINVVNDSLTMMRLDGTDIFM